MVLMRRLTLKCMKTNISVRATHVPSKNNTAADLSRLQIQRFRELVPNQSTSSAYIEELHNVASSSNSVF